jgi:predicted DNA-binding transcriptional regulator AlpA
VPITRVVERQPYRDDDMLTKVQLGQALNVSTRTIDRWLAEDSGPPYIKLPHGSLRWRWGTVRKWLVEHGDEP